MNDVKLKDIASITGVSISTVSRILSGDKTRKMKEETVKEVIKVASALGYYSSKRKKLGKAIGRIRLAVLFVSDHESLASPFFSEIIDGIYGEVKALSEYMELSIEVLSLEEDGFLSHLESGEIDAAVILGRTNSFVLDTIKKNIPSLIYAGLNSVGGIDEVLCNVRDGIKEGVSYLKSLGKDKICYLGPGKKQGLLNEYRYLGYIEGLADCGLEQDDNLIEDIYLSINDGYQGIRNVLSRAKPNAIIAANDNVALGALKYLEEAGVAVPDEIAVLGFDNIEMSSHSNPPLTTFDVPKKELGRFAVIFLIDRIENPRDRNIRICVPYELIERESTKGQSTKGERR